MHHYCLYGQTVESEIPLFEKQNGNQPQKGGLDSIKLLRDTLGPKNPELQQVAEPSISHGRAVSLFSESTRPMLDYQGAWRMEIESVVVFAGMGSDNLIKFESVASVGDDLVSFWFVHQVLPMYLSYLKGWDFLHAAAIEEKGHAVLFLAPSLGGKSTMAEYFVSVGHGLISDDKVAVKLIAGRISAIASHDRYRPYRKVEDLGKKAPASSSNELPIKAVFLLKPVNKSHSIKIERMTRQQGFDTYVDSSLFDADRLSVHIMGSLGALAKQIPMFRIEVPQDKNRLPEVYQHIAKALGADEATSISTLAG
jgi:hypothetical protein